MDCTIAEKNMNSLIKGTLKGNELRKTYYHIEKCNACKEVLLDEFSFYTTFNDLDIALDFNYKKKLDELLNTIKNNIENGDAILKTKYIIISVLINVLFIILLIATTRLMYLKAI